MTTGDTSRERRRRGTSAVVVAVAVGATVVSCGGESLGPLDLQVHEIPSPAEGWSAQPRLASSASGILLSWLETRADADGRETTLLVDEWTNGSWSGRRTVARGEDLLINWADYPSVLSLGDDGLAAHWLVRGGRGGEDYGIRVSTSEDHGRSWAEPWIPHEDRSPVAHGFASLLPLEGGFRVVWLDGRGGDPEQVSLWTRSASAGGPTGPEVLLDRQVCECCETDAAVTSRGPVVVYRDRSPEEVRDIQMIRWVDGGWEDPRPVHSDGWVFPACPINGPAVAATGDRVAVGWFTAADDTPRVRLAFSSDAGASFDPPIRIDDGRPSGRVDVILLADGSALVSWLEGVEGGAEVRVRRVDPSGRRSESARITRTGGGQASGFPRMAVGPDSEVLFAWTDPGTGSSRIRLARARLMESP